MIKSKITLLTLFALLVVTPISHAGKVYKWLDDEGVTHYGEAPPDATTETTELRTRTKPSSSDKEPTEASPKKNDLTAVESNKKQQKENDEIAVKNKEIHKKNCEVNRKNLRILTDTGRVKLKDPETGEPRFMTSEEIVEKKASFEKYLKECE